MLTKRDYGTYIFPGTQVTKMPLLDLTRKSWRKSSLALEECRKASKDEGINYFD